MQKVEEMSESRQQFQLWRRLSESTRLDRHLSHSLCDVFVCFSIFSSCCEGFGKPCSCSLMYFKFIFVFILKIYSHFKVKDSHLPSKINLLKMVGRPLQCTTHQFSPTTCLYSNCFHNQMLWFDWENIFSYIILYLSLWLAIIHGPQRMNPTTEVNIWLCMFDLKQHQIVHWHVQTCENTK